MFNVRLGKILFDLTMDTIAKLEVAMVAELVVGFCKETFAEYAIASSNEMSKVKKSDNLDSRMY